MDYRNVVIALLFVACIILQTHAQLQTPSWRVSDFVEGRSSTIACEVLVNDGQATLTISRSDQVGVDLGGDYTSSQIGDTGIWSSRKTYTFLPTRSMNIDRGTLKFTCVAGYDGETKSTSWAIRVYVEPTGPTITSSHIVVSDHVTVLTCRATEGLPSPTLYWQIGSANPSATSVTTENGDSTYNVVSTLNFTFTPQDDGRYIYCNMMYDLNSNPKMVSQRLSVQYAPNVTVASTSYTVSEGGTVTLQCTVTSVPEAHFVKWTRNGHDLDLASGRFVNGNSASQPSLTINDVNATDRGSYVCSATNTLATAESVKVTLMVKYRPKLTISTFFVTTDEGKSIKLSCTIDADPDITLIKWIKIKDGSETTLTMGDRFTGGSLTSPTTLTITSVIPEDAGKYRCQATNDKGTGNSRETTVVVNYAPRAVTITPPSVAVLEGHPINIQCSADAFPAPSYTWSYPPNESSAGPLLSVASATVEHNGLFVCTATNAMGSTKKEIRINVLYSPRIEVSPSPLSANTGVATMTISCVIDANPPVTSVSWRKDLNVLDLSTPAGKYSGGTLESPSLVIHNVEVSDEGSYVCGAQNDQSAMVFSTEVEVKISYAPTNMLLIPLSPVTFREGNNYILTCRADGVPEPTFVWTLDGAVKGTGASLEFVSAGPDDAGVYTCNATNVRGSAAKQTTVIVEYSPKFSLPSSSFGGDKGGSLIISYTIKAHPKITTFEWFKDGAKLDLTSPEGKYQDGLSNSSRLVINDLQPSDAGVYSVKATNPMGTAQTDPINVAISYAPRNTQTSPSNSVVVTEGDTTVIACTSDAFPPATFTWSKDGNRIASTANLTVAGATPGDSGQIRCTATNEKGSDSVDFNVVVRYTPRAYKPYSTLDIPVGQTARLECAAHAFPPVTRYSWSYGNRSLPETGPTLSVTPTSSNPVFYGVYTCTATNEVGTSDDVLIKLQETRTTQGPKTGASTAASGLSVTAIVLIILALILLLIIIILIVCCYKHGICSKLCHKKKSGKGRVAPKTSERHLAAVEIPHLTDQKKEPNYTSGESRNPSSTTISRKDVDVNVNQFPKPLESKVIVEDDYDKHTLLPNGTGGPIISIHNKPYQLPPLDHELQSGTPEKKRKHKRKRRRYKNEETGQDSHRSESANIDVEDAIDDI